MKTFSYRQGFRNLPENASHRVLVAFRWYAADGTLVERAKRRSARCRQFVALPNLVASITKILPTNVQSVVRYETSVASLAPGERRSVVIRGPVCHGLVRLEVDPDKAIAESSDGDNVHELDCAALR